MEKENFGVYVIYDLATESYGLPFAANNQETAFRSVVSSLLNLDDNVINDFELIEIGQFDSENGKIDGYELPISVASPKTILMKVTQAREELESIKRDALEELESLKKLKMEVK